MRTTELKHGITINQVVAPGNKQATVNGTAVDLANSEQAIVVIDVGTVTDGSFTIEVQEADDDGTGTPGAWTAVADADLDGAELAALVANTVTVIGYTGIKRHLRVVATDTGVGNADFGVTVITGSPRVR